MSELDGLRSAIANRKQKLDELWYKRNSAKILGDAEMEHKARLELAQTELENCSLISQYVRTANHAIANELDERIKMATQGLDVISDSNDPDLLHSWYREQLAPLLNKVEQEGLLVSEMEKKGKQIAA